MKMKIAAIVCLLIVIIGLILYFLTGSKSVDIKDIKSFSFGYTCGNTAYANVNYSLKLEDGVYTASIKPAHVPEEEEETFVVDKAFVEELEAFLAENKVGKWNGFNKSDSHVMDGDGFHLYIHTQDGTSLDAHGYMMWPKNYSIVTDGIEAIFEKWKK